MTNLHVRPRSWRTVYRQFNRWHRDGPVNRNLKARRISLDRERRLALILRRVALGSGRIERLKITRLTGRKADAV